MNKFPLALIEKIWFNLALLALLLLSLSLSLLRKRFDSTRAISYLHAMFFTRLFVDADSVNLTIDRPSSSVNVYIYISRYHLIPSADKCASRWSFLFFSLPLSIQLNQHTNSFPRTLFFLLPIWSVSERVEFSFSLFSFEIKSNNFKSFCEWRGKGSRVSHRHHRIIIDEWWCTLHTSSHMYGVDGDVSTRSSLDAMVCTRSSISIEKDFSLAGKMSFLFSSYFKRFVRSILMEKPFGVGQSRSNEQAVR